MILQRKFIENRYICVPALLPDAPELRIEDFVKDFIEDVMILMCHTPDDVVQERRDARGHGHARAVLRDVLAHVLVVVVNTQSVVLRSY